MSRDIVLAARVVLALGHLRLLLLVVPTLLLAGQPEPEPVTRVLRFRVLRVVAHPALSPLYVPVGAALAIDVVEPLVDAVPGIVLRL